MSVDNVDAENASVGFTGGSDKSCPLFKLKGPTVLHVQIAHGFRSEMMLRIMYGS